MKTASTASALFLLSIIVFNIWGWVLNIIKLAVLRIFGLLVVPIGAVMGWFVG